jgi:hypothetical protein
MPKLSTILIDFSEASLDLDRADLEEFLLSIADEMQSGDLAEDARLARRQPSLD